MANGIYDLISRSIQDAKNSVGANNLNNFAQNMVPGLGQHIQDLEGIKQTTRGPEYFQKSTENMTQNISDAYGKAPVVGGINQGLIEMMAPVGSLAAGLFYDPYSAYDRMEPGSGFKGYREALAKENMGTSLPNRFVGAAQPLANRIESGNFPLSLNNVMDMGRSIKDNVGNFFFSPAGAAERITPNIPGNVPSNFVDAGRDFSQLGDVDSFRSMMERMSERPSENTLQARQASSARSLGMDKEIEKEEGIFSLGDILADLGRKGVEGFKDVAGRGIKSQAYGGVGTILGGPVVGGIGALAGLLTGGDMFNKNTLSQRTFDSMTPGQQSYTSGLYNPGELLEGYNQISGTGKGAIGTLGDRLSTIQNTLTKQGANPSTVLQQREQQIKDAINRSINIGEREALADPNKNVGGIRTDIDVADGGAETSGGKIVCTMMNESYGFGNFRNKIWLKHSKNLPKEYEIGYHKIFLPLVKFAKGQGKLNKAVKKTLEHVARHRTLDLKQEMKGKTHLLGRIYRKILEPICFIVGKISNND